MNPFSQFEGGPAGTFINCLPSAFYTAVGLILIQQRAENAWIANLDTTQNVSTSSSGGLFKSTTTTTLTTQTKLQWALITHPDLPIAGAVHTGYKLPNGNTVYSAAHDQTGQGEFCARHVAVTLTGSPHQQHVVRRCSVNPTI